MDRNNQAQLRVEMYNKLIDYLNTEADENIEPGMPLTLISSFTGSPRNMHQYFQDAMSIVKKHGKPDLFITYTGKQPNVTPDNSPDLVARVYKSHLAELMRDIKDRHILGVPLVRVHVIEFQKRCLSNCDMLLAAL